MCTMLYSPGCCEVVSVLVGVEVGVVADCDLLLSADTTHQQQLLYTIAEYNYKGTC